VGKIPEKAVCRSVFLTTWHCIPSDCFLAILPTGLKQYLYKICHCLESADDLFESKPVSISDILTMDVDLSELYVDVEEDDVKQTCSQESPVDMIYNVDEDIPEHVLKVFVKSLIC